MGLFDKPTPVGGIAFGQGFDVEIEQGVPTVYIDETFASDLVAKEARHLIESDYEKNWLVESEMSKQLYRFFENRLPGIVERLVAKRFEEFIRDASEQDTVLKAMLQRVESRLYADLDALIGKVTKQVLDQLTAPRGKAS